MQIDPMLFWNIILTVVFAEVKVGIEQNFSKWFYNVDYNYYK